MYTHTNIHTHTHIYIYIFSYYTVQFLLRGIESGCHRAQNLLLSNFDCVSYMLHLFRSGSY